MPDGAKRWSARASVMSSGLPSSSRNWQGEPARRICRALKPTVDLNQTRDQSRNPINAYGASQMDAAMRAISSKAGSGSVSRMSYSSRDFSRSVSSCCTVVELVIIGISASLAINAQRANRNVRGKYQQRGIVFSLGGKRKHWVHPTLRSLLLY